MVPVALGLVVALSGAGAYALQGRRALLEDQLARRARAVLAGVEATAREAILTERLEALRRLVERIGREDKDVQRLTVLDRNGEVLAGTPPSSDRGGEVLYYNAYLQARGFPLGQVQLVLRQARIQESLDQATLFLLLCLVDTVLLAGFLVHMTLKHMVTRPLAHLAEATDALAGGAFGRRVDLSTRDELGLVGAAFNDMGKRLESYRAEVDETHRTLEARVRQRTRDLSETQARTQAILEGLPVGVLVVDSRLRIQTANPAGATLAGMPAADLTGATCAEIVDSRFCRQDCLLARARAGENHLEETTLTRGEAEVPVLLDCAPLGDGGVVNLRDVSHLKQMTQQIRRSDRLSSLGTLAAGLAHEINNPLGNLSTYAQLLEEGQGDPQRVSRAVRTIRSEAERASRIVGRLLAFARPSAGVRQRLELGATCQEAQNLLGPVLERDGVTLTCVPGARPALVDAEPGQVQQVLVNLVMNASHATGQGGAVRIEVLDEGAPGFRVVDDGPGIPEESLESLFDPFYTTKEAGEGTGLGLSVCYGIMRDHGGTLSLANRPEGGAVAEVRFPEAGTSTPPRHEDDEEAAGDDRGA